MEGNLVTNPKQLHQVLVLGMEGNCFKVVNAVDNSMEHKYTIWLFFKKRGYISTYGLVTVPQYFFKNFGTYTFDLEPLLHII